MALVINTYIKIVTVCLNLFHVAASQNHTLLHGVPTADPSADPNADPNADIDIFVNCNWIETRWQ